jgi:hypothetical protein
MPVKRRFNLMRRRAVSAAVVLSAVALAGPVAQASAATPAVPGLPSFPALPAFQMPAFSGLPAFTPAPLSFVGPSIGQIAVAIGPTVIGSVFNGGTTVCVSTVAAICSTPASP